MNCVYIYVVCFTCYKFLLAFLTVVGVVDNMLKFDGNKDGYLTFAEMRVYYMHNNLL
jgi:hypothetical protein